MSEHIRTNYDAKAELESIQQETRQYMLRVLTFCECQSLDTEAQPMTQAMEESFFTLKSAADSFILLATASVHSGSR